MATLMAWSCGDISRADVSFDGSVGGPPGGLSGPDYMIPSSRGEIAGPNLFHSFGQFNLANGESATFSGPANIGNILARVTGGASTINGEIRSDIAGANLFLVNQAGIMFGNGASVNVSGAFNATTANYILLEDGQQFSASPTGDVTMLVAPPAAFGFLDGAADSGAIDFGVGFSSSFGDTEQVHLVGRSVEVRSSKVELPGGEIGLAAMGESSGEVGIDSGTGRLLSAEDLGGSVGIQGAILNVSGADNGRIAIRSGELVIGGSSELIGDSVGLGNGGVIDVETKNSMVLEENSRIRSFSRNASDGGLISIRSGGIVTLRTGGEITASTFSTRDGGEIRINSQNLIIDAEGATTNTRLSAQSTSFASGSGGTITAAVNGAVEILNGGQVVANTFGAGDAGTVSVAAGTMTLDGENAPTFAAVGGGLQALPTSIAASSFRGSSMPAVPGKGGDINVDVVGEVQIRNRATIEATTDTRADAGTIDFRSGSLTILGSEHVGLVNEFLTGILGLTTLHGVAEDGSSLLGGQGGNVFVNVADTINLLRGGQIDTSSFGGGDAGFVEVRARHVIADRAGSDFFTGIGSDTEAYDDRDLPNPVWGGPGGRAGDVTVWADESITLLNGANISSSSAGSGDAGNVMVTAPRIEISGLGSDKVFTPGPEAGIVALTEGGDLDDPDDPGRPIPPSTGNAGSVVVNTSLLNIVDGGKVSAEALGTGTAGDVTVNADGGSVNLDTEGRVSARSEREGDAGLVGITADKIVISGDGAVESLNRGSGEAGGVELSATNIQLKEGSISAVAEQAEAGNITLNVGNNLEIEQGSVSASAGTDGGSIIFSAGRLVLADGSNVEAEAQGNGGNILINDATFFLSDRSLFNASAVNGDGGNIGINTGVFLENLSVFDVSSQFGASGAVQISPLNSLSGSEGEVEVAPLDATEQLQPECTQRLATKSGSFIRSGKGGSPRLPGGYLPSVRLIRNEASRN